MAYKENENFDQVPEVAVKAETKNNLWIFKKTLLIALATTVSFNIADAQTTGPEKKPENTKPTTEQVATTPTDSNKVVTVLPPRPKRNLDKSTAWDDVVKQAQQEAATAKKEAATAKKEAATAKQELAITQKTISAVKGLDK